MAGTLLDNTIVSIYNTGFFDYVLPFMVAFAVIYGILQKTNILGEDKKRLNALFALIVSLIIMPFAANLSYATYLSKVVVVIFGYIVLMMVLVMLGYKFEQHKKYSVPIAFVLVLLMLATEFFDVAAFLQFRLRSELMYGLLIIIVFGLVFWMITKPKKEREEVVKEGEKPELPGYKAEKIARIPGEELEKPGKKYPK